MIDPAAIPHADKLEIVASQNGKWFLFDFSVSDGHERISMDTANFPAAFNGLLAALTVPALANVTGPDIFSHGYSETEAIKPLQCASSITALGDSVIVAFELPGAVQFRVVLPLADAKRLQFAITESVQLCGNRQNLTKQ